SVFPCEKAWPVVNGFDLRPIAHFRREERREVGVVRRASECLTDAPLEKACHYAGIATLGHGVATELVGRRNPHPTPASKRGASAVGLDEGGIQQPVQG